MGTVLKKKKTNFDYLSELIESHLAPAKQDEAKEFLEAINNEYVDMKDELKSKEDELDNKQTEIQELEEDISYSNKIETNLGSQGVISWSVDNISCKSMMEELGNAISRGITITEIENALRTL